MTRQAQAESGNLKPLVQGHTTQKLQTSLLKTKVLRRSSSCCNDSRSWTRELAQVSTLQEANFNPSTLAHLYPPTPSLQALQGVTWPKAAILLGPSIDPFNLLMTNKSGSKSLKWIPHFSKEKKEVSCLVLHSLQAALSLQCVNWLI